MTTLASELEKRRAGRTQMDFAAFLGISQGRLSEILAGKAIPGLSKTAAAIIEHYPELAAFFLPRNIAEAKEHRQSEIVS